LKWKHTPLPNFPCSVVFIFSCIYFLDDSTSTVTMPIPNSSSTICKDEQYLSTETWYREGGLAKSFQKSKTILLLLM
jgi:hypothetical protein